MKTVTQKQIDTILDNATFYIKHAIFGKQCIVVAKIYNGFTIVGESACVDPKNYNEEIGFELAKKDIEKQLWMLEGYKLQNQIDKSKEE